jgi:hypothetical protein
VTRGPVDARATVPAGMNVAVVNEVEKSRPP